MSATPTNTTPDDHDTPCTETPSGRPSRTIRLPLKLRDPANDADVETSAHRIAIEAHRKAINQAKSSSGKILSGDTTIRFVSWN